MQRSKEVLYIAASRDGQRYKLEFTKSSLPKVLPFNGMQLRLETLTQQSTLSAMHCYIPLAPRNSPFPQLLGVIILADAKEHKCFWKNAVNLICESNGSEINTQTSYQTKDAK